MWVAYNRYIMRDGWATEQMEVDLTYAQETSKKDALTGVYLAD